MRHWVRFLMCLPMFLAALLMWLAGAGSAALALALTCALMTVVMVAMAACNGADRR